MWINAKNSKITIDDTYMDYISFGKGEKVFVMIPGLGDGLKSVRGMALPLAFMYRAYGKKYRVLMFSRKRTLPETYNSRDMARDLHTALQQLGIEKADIMGVSQGGTVAQYLALDYPETVNKLVLAVTYGKSNETLKNAIGGWIEYAKANDYAGLMMDTAEKFYSEKYLKKNRWMYPVVTKVGAPKSFHKFLVMADACLQHDAYDLLGNIPCPTFIIGGKQDKIVSGEASFELAQAIRNSELFMYEEYGHGVYEEARDFGQRVMGFLEK